MLEIRGSKLPVLPIVGLEWVRDLDKFDGPFLSHFRHRRGDNYLYYWCDCNEELNRWMIFRVNETDIIRLINRLIPLDHIIPNGFQDDFVYLVDLNAKREAKQIVLLRTDLIPPEYTPSPGAFLEHEVVEQLGSYSILIEQDLSIKVWSDLPKDFSHAYAFLYNLIVLQSEKLRAHPWRGGFSAMHFYREILCHIPTEDYPRLETLQYASPGFMRLKLDSKVAVILGDLIAKYQRNKQQALDSYENLHSYIKINRLNDENLDTAAEIWSQHDPEISRLTETLLSVLEIPSTQKFLEAPRRPFEAAKMTLAFARRLKDLAGMESDRLVRFPHSLSK